MRKITSPPTLEEPQMTLAQLNLDYPNSTSFDGDTLTLHMDDHGLIGQSNHAVLSREIETRGWGGQFTILPEDISTPTENPEIIAWLRVNLSALEDYPVLDDEHFSDLQWETIHVQWDSMADKEKEQFLRDLGYTPGNPEYDNRELVVEIYEALREDLLCN